MKRVLLTGAAGNVGQMIRPMLVAAYPDLILSDLKPVPNAGAEAKFIAADLSRLEDCERICEGVDGVIHLGGYSVDGPWEMILQSNIIGCYNLFEAARRQGVKRVVFASSNHAVGFYPRVQRIGVDAVGRPDGRYGLSKHFGEGVGALYAFKHGLRVLCLRIGNVGELPVDVRRLAIWLKPSDLVQLIRIGLEHPDLRFEVMYGASLNERSWWDNSVAYKYGYRPTGRAEDFSAHAIAEQAKLPPDPVGDFYQGGTFCSFEYSADTDEIWS